MSEHNASISEEVLRLTHSFGNLLVHVSGEGKVDFRTPGMGSGWLGMIKIIISGDVGCMKPYKGYDTCALDQAIDYLIDIELAPHLNTSLNEEFVVSDERWKAFIMSIKEECSFVGNPKPKYKFELKSDDDKHVVTTIVLEPLANDFVVGEFTAAKHATFIGPITDYDQPKINSCFIVAEGKEYEIDFDKLIHYRHRKYIPRPGDYLLYNEEKGFYVILPQEDYSIH
ncbi:hypothetical protein D5W64_12690 [Salmonella enterica subsp. enterica serovar Saintpaul]|nr:hypothetical protein [Salmonella enterica subsp. enterica serovar Saintpaul]